MASYATLRAASYVLAVPDARATARWWVDRMGFQQTTEAQGWTFVERGSVAIRLGTHPDAPHPRDIGEHQLFAFIEVDDIDAFHAEIVGRGAKPDKDILAGPMTLPSGLREMTVRTPDGHRILFSQRTTSTRWQAFTPGQNARR